MKRHCFALVRIALLGLGAWLAVGGTPPADPADAAVGNAGPIAVTITPTVGLVGGQQVAIHAEAPAGVLIYEMAVHVCVPFSGVNTSYEWGFQGPVCPNIALVGGDLVKSAEFPNGVQVADLDGFRVGTGNVRWIDERGLDHEMTCGPGFPCDLVVKVEITNDTVFATSGICYGEGCGPEPGQPPPPPAETEAAPASDDAATGPGGTGGNQPGDGTGSGGDDRATESASGGSKGDASTDDSKDGDGPSRVRVFAAGMVGAACSGARLVQVLARMRRGWKGT